MKHAITTTRSFEYMFSDMDNIKNTSPHFATSFAEKIRKQKSSNHDIYVTLSSKKHKKYLEQYRAGKIISLPFPTDSTLIISQQAVSAVTTIFQEEIEYKRAGVIVMGLVPTNNYQDDLLKAKNLNTNRLCTP